MRPTPRSIITIDLDAVRHNVAFLRGRLAPGVRFLVAVKADGYGHGIAPCAFAAVEAGADGAAVATAEEAIALRDSRFIHPILVMGPLFGTDQCEEMACRSIEFAVVSDAMASMVLGLDTSTSAPAAIHLKVDTGMSRQGLSPEQVTDFLAALRSRPGVTVAGVMTHFASAAEDPQSVDLQLRRFLPCVQQVKQQWPGALAHAANSAATMTCPRAHLDMVRCGIGVYGLSPGQADARADGLRPVLSWTSQVALTRRVPAGEGVGYGLTFRPSQDTNIALVPVGYADGVFRRLGNRGEVLIQGRRYPMVGRVSMDSFAVDVGQDVAVKPGEKVTIIGREGDQWLTAEDLAVWAETINYEITCNVATARAQRFFLGSGKTWAETPDQLPSGVCGNSPH